MPPFSPAGERTLLIGRLLVLLDHLVELRIGEASCVDLIRMSGVRLHPRMMASIEEADRILGCPRGIRGRVVPPPLELPPGTG